MWFTQPLTFLGVMGTVLLGSYALSNLIRISMGRAIPLVIFFITIVTFIFGSVQLLAAAPITIVICVVLTAIFSRVRRKAPSPLGIKQALFSPTVAIYSTYGLVTFLLTRQMLFTSWDEFSHWGTVVKAMYIFDSLSPFNPADLMFRSYPPGAASFEYFVSKLGFGWLEGNAIWAYELALGALFLPFSAALKWRHWGRISLAVAIFAATSILFYDGFFGVLIEPLLAATFGYVLALIAVEKKWNSVFHLQFIAGLVFLILLKDSGKYLAIVACAFYILHFALSRTQVAGWRKLLLSLVPVSIALLAAQFWSLLLDLSGAARVFSNPIGLESVTSALTGVGEGYRAEVITKFQEALWSLPLNPGMRGPDLGWWSWFTLVGVLIAGMYFAKQKFPRNWLNILPAMILLLGGLIYEVGLLVLYLTRFSEAEALGLAAMQRYLSTYMAGIVVFLSMSVTQIISEFRFVSSGGVTSLTTKFKPWLDPRIIFSAVYVVLLVYLTPINALTNHFPKATQTIQEFREPLTEIQQTALNLGVQPGDRVMVIAQHSDGFEYWVLKYSLLPADVRSPWSIGEIASDGEAWTDGSINSETFNEHLSQFDYVLLYYIDDAFIDQFGSYFSSESEILAPRLYRVENNQGRFSLVAVP